MLKKCVTVSCAGGHRIDLFTRKEEAMLRVKKRNFFVLLGIGLLAVLVSACSGGGGGGGGGGPTAPPSSGGSPFTGTFVGTFTNPVRRVTLPASVQSAQSGISVSGTITVGSTRGSFRGSAAVGGMVGRATFPSFSCNMVLDRTLSSVLGGSQVDGVLDCSAASPFGSGSLSLRAV